MTEVERPDLRVIYGGGPSPGQEPQAVYLTIADVARACRLPQPVIAQLVPRTWTDEGWMYTEAQLEVAIEIASSRPGPSRHRLTLISRTTDRDIER